MKNNDTIELLKTFANAIFDPTSITNNIRESSTLKYPRGLELNNSINNIYEESEDSNEEYNESDSGENSASEDSESYSDDKNNCYYNKQKNTSSNPQGVIDSITQEITSVRLQQAIILSEIVGKPRSKTRKKRRF
jgi:deoxyribodipyrimidine photolyase